VPYKNLVIGASWHQLWAWDRVSGKLKWEYAIPNNCLRLYELNIPIIGDKIVCMINNKNTYYGATVPYILIVDAESGALINQYVETKYRDEVILENLTTFTDQHIIIKRGNGLITCYDTDFNIVESYQSTEVDNTDDEYKIILATPRFIVDIDFCFITIIDRYLGTVSTLLPTHDPCAAYIHQERLICGFRSNGKELPAIPFQIIDLLTASVVYEYKIRLFGCGKPSDKDKLVINSIAMRNQDVFLIADGHLYYVNMKTHKNVILKKLTEKINDASIEIYDNYLFVTLGHKKYRCSMWDIESMQKMLVKRKVYDKPSWNDGRLFITNNVNYVCADFNDKPLVNSVKYK
jgi:outer membrane protein assembly factor BamB